MARKITSTCPVITLEVAGQDYDLTFTAGAFNAIDLNPFDAESARRALLSMTAEKVTTLLQHTLPPAHRENAEEIAGAMGIATGVELIAAVLEEVGQQAEKLNTRRNQPEPTDRPTAA